VGGHAPILAFIQEKKEIFQVRGCLKPPLPIRIIPRICTDWSVILHIVDHHLVEIYWPAAEISMMATA
jgi:hypothetical protein